MLIPRLGLGADPTQRPLPARTATEPLRQRDQAVLSGRIPRPGSRRKTLLLASAGLSLAMTLTGALKLAPYLGSPGTDALLRHDPDVTQQDRATIEKQVAPFGEPVLRWLAQDGAQLQVTHSDLEVAQLLASDGTVQLIDRARMMSEAVKIGPALAEITASPDWKAVDTQLASARARLTRASASPRPQRSQVPVAVPTTTRLEQSFQPGSQIYELGPSAPSHPRDSRLQRLQVVLEQHPNAYLAVLEGVEDAALLADRLSSQLEQVKDHRTGQSIGLLAVVDRTHTTIHYRMASGLKALGQEDSTTPLSRTDLGDQLESVLGPAGEAVELASRKAGLKQIHEFQQLEARRDDLLKQGLSQAGISPGWADGPRVPTSVKELVRASGAANPAEIAEFLAYFRAANADRLQGIGDDVPFDLGRQLVLVPPVRVVRSSYEAVLVTPDSDPHELSMVARGGMFTASAHRLQVDAENAHTGFVPHELTHAIEALLKREDPTAWQKLMDRATVLLDQARERAGRGEQPFSRYGLTDRHEYLAEGMRGLFLEREALGQRDPGLQELVIDTLQVARERQPDPTTPLAWMLGLGLAGLGASARGLQTRPEGHQR